MQCNRGSFTHITIQRDAYTVIVHIDPFKNGKTSFSPFWKTDSNNGKMERIEIVMINVITLRCYSFEVQRFVTMDLNNTKYLNSCCF